MTPTDLVEIVAGAMYRSDSDEVGQCGDEAYYQRQARAALAALTEAGTVEWGVRWHVGGFSGINRCTSKRHAERQAAKLIESGHEATVVSRLTLPWGRAE